VPALGVLIDPLAALDSPRRILLLGGTQPVAAMAVGTASIAKVDLLAGPGNPYVDEAKRQLFGEVGIDLFAGPTEILIIADDQADPFVVAVDLLSRAEHGPDSRAVLITTSADLGKRVSALVDKLLVGMPTADFAGPAWRDFGEIAVIADLDSAYALAERYASEHVQILTEHPREALKKMRNYGALFLGEGTCVSYGGARSSAPTTHCRPAARRTTPAASGSASISRPSPTRK
jgi:sulfopropanediol 3-dehydrogenase